MATQSKSQFLSDVHTLLKRRYKPKPDKATGRLSVLEAVVYGICHEDATREQANQALSRFKDQFFDWNEVRVSPIAEVQETLADIPDPQARAHRIRKFLRQLFEKTYSFAALDALTKKPLKEALKVLGGFEAFSSDYVTATVVQQALGGHAIPVDASTRRALGRLGISEPDVPSLRAVLERAVPKNRGVEFIELLEELAHDTCVERPECPRCELRKICPYALAKKYEAAATAQAAKARPAASARAADGAKASADGARAAKKPAEKDKEKSKDRTPAARTAASKEAPRAKSDKRKPGGK
jgi:endonuclease-3